MGIKHFGMNNSANSYSPGPEIPFREQELSKFSQTLQDLMAASAVESSTEQEILDLEKQGLADRTQWLLNPPEPPGLLRAFKETVSPFGNKLQSLNRQSRPKRVVSVLQEVFPIVSWCQEYKAKKFKNDLLAGLTLASLCIPQSIGYATLAKLAPQYGLYTSVVPPLIYAVMGTSREIAIGPVAVISLLLSSMAAFGLFRSGFLVDFLSHAAIVGFMAGAAIVIGLQQLKGLLGISHFTNKTDVMSVMEAVWKSLYHHHWNPHDCILGCSFLIFILTTRFLGKRNRKLFWLPAIAPLISVVLSTVIVIITRADKHGVKTVKHIKGGLNPSSVHQLQFNSPHVGEVAKIGLIVAIVALTEAVAVGRSFASSKGYHLDGNKEMVAMGFMNLVGSFTSCYVATGSFSRSAVNFSAGCETAVSNIVMAITVFISLEFFTKLLYYTPVAILASIILSALPGLIDFSEAFRIWKVDKLDFLACMGAFLGVVIGSAEIGLLVAVTLSFVKIILISIQPGIDILGRLPGTDVFCDVNQYPMAVKPPGLLIVRIKSSLLCFANANFVRERIMKRISNKEDEDTKEKDGRTIQLLLLDMSNLMEIDTSGIASLEELQKHLDSKGIKLAIANPRWRVIHKLRLVNFVGKIAGRVFLTAGEAMLADQK
ncbi:hypothetical protein Pint_26652 [Pistacia integerrima]|uniref:Uncharacterized protein n=1 Tax=Pistacia integerrima TaxID=434235 RepID=A0ACC0YSM7_9ROSI|nr:hypothetical protein Pint_26652 [Pistacia integerrima]